MLNISRRLESNTSTTPNACHVGLLIEATAGNTGIGLIHIAKQYNCKCLFVAPDKTSSEKVELLKTLGAEVELAPTVPITGESYYYHNSQLHHRSKVA